MYDRQTSYDERHKPDRLLSTLEHLLAIEATEVKPALSQAAQLIGDALYAEKVDAFLFEPSSNSLLSLGSNDTPMSHHQRALGLDRQQIANGGRMVEVFLTGDSYICGRVDEDQQELRGVRTPEPKGLGIVSQIGASFEVNGERRGVLMAGASMHDFFTEKDLRFIEAAARWVGMVTHRAELVEQQTKEAVELGRRLAAEELLTIMAHDLRNYLTPLKGHLNLIERRARREERAADLRDAQVAISTLTRLNHLISNLLDVARLDQGLFAIQPQPINLVSLIGELLPAFTTSDVHIHVHAEHELELSADPDRLRQVLENLLANAVKHAFKQTPIDVTVETEQRDDGEWAKVVVSNQGTTIPPDLLAHLFQPFVAGSSSTGLGLGLYLAKSIAVAHQGSLSVDAPQGTGQVHFTLYLPTASEYGTENTCLRTVLPE